MKFDHITSDIHFGHVNILDYCVGRRGYLGLSDADGVEAMNEALVELWNRQVRNGETVLVIGDICMGRILETLQVIPRLNGTIFLIPGNHDRMMSEVCKSAEKRARWINEYNSVGINILPEQIVHEFDDVTATVCHFPFDGDHTDEVRFADARPVDDGQFHVHGHLHDEWRTNGRQLNVGIDAWDGNFLTERQIGEYFRNYKDIG